MAATAEGLGTGYRYGVEIQSGNTVSVDIALGNQTCVPVGSIQVCADDLTEAPAGVWSGHSNIRIASHLLVHGDVTVDTRSGQEMVSGAGEVRFDLGNGLESLAIYQGNYDIDIHSALVDMEAGALRKLEELSGFRLLREPAITLDGNGSLTVSNAQIEMQQPHQLP